jgi:predicted nucleotidyltransferase
MDVPGLEDIRCGILAVAPRYSIKKVSLFGSYAEGRQTAASDIDLLVEFREPAVSLLTLAALQQDLEAQLGVAVDVLHAPLPQEAMIHPGKVVPLYE